MLRRRSILVLFLLAYLHCREDLFVISSVLYRLHAIIPLYRFNRGSVRLPSSSARLRPPYIASRVHHFIPLRVLLQAHARCSDPARGKVLNLAVNQVITIVVRFGPLFVLFRPVDAIFFEARAATHFVLGQVVVFNVGLGIDEVIHLGHEEILMVSLVIWLSSGPRLPLCLSRPAFLRQVIAWGLASEPTAGQRWSPQLPARLLHLA